MRKVRRAAAGLIQQGKNTMTKPKPTQWKPGQTGNPKGRPPGKSTITKMRDSLAADVPEILVGLVTAAKAGDIQAARLVLERVLPPVKPTEQTVAIALPESGTLTAKANAVLTAAAAGALPPGQAAQLIAALGTLAKLSEVDELAARITALEAKNGQS
jgi:hypothetical protein